MSHPVKCALITALVSKTKDGFHEYNADKALGERLELVSKMKGMSKLKQFPLTGFVAVIEVTLGMFLLLYWHVYNTFRVSQTLTNEYASGLALGSQILSGHLNLMYDAYLVVSMATTAR